MKKLKYLILLVLFIPSLVNASECNYYELENYRKELGNITYTVEYVPKGTQYGIEGDMQTVDNDNTLKVFAPYLNDNYQLEFQGSDNSTYLVSSHVYSFLTGGVYNVSVYNNVCKEPITTLQVMIPHYKQFDNKKDSWFDGTYENNQSGTSSNIKNIINTKLIIIFAALIIIITVLVIVMKKNRSAK